MNFMFKKTGTTLTLSLFWRLFLSLLAMIIITSTLSILVERWLNEQALDERMEVQIASLLLKRQQLIPLLNDGNWEEVRNLYRQDWRLMSQIVIYNEQGDIILPRNRNTRRERSHDNQPAVATELKANIHSVNTVDNNHAKPTENKSFTFLDDIANVSPSYKDRQNVIGLDSRPELADVRVVLPDAQTLVIQLRPQLLFRDIIELQRGYFSLRLLFIVVFSVFVCFWLSRNLTRRIKRVQDTVHRLMVGDYHTSSELTQLGSDELGTLAKDVSQLSTRLAESELARKQMLSDISHELRSPLARLEVATELTRDFAPDARRYLDRIDKESARMNELIEQIIRIQSLQMQQYHTTNRADLESVNLWDLLTEIGEDVGFEFQSKQIYWQFTQSNDANKATPSEDSADAWSILGKQEQLHSALENVIRNAFIHTAPNATVRAKISKTIVDQNIHAIRISIIDEGGGVAQEDLVRIFQPFVRLDSARNRQTGGYGLGLAIVHAVIKSHQGHIDIHNRQDGIKGLVVQITLPLTISNHSLITD